MAWDNFAIYWHYSSYQLQHSSYEICVSESERETWQSYSLSTSHGRIRWL